MENYPIGALEGLKCKNISVALVTNYQFKHFDFFPGQTEPLLCKFADGGNKKRNQNRQQQQQQTLGWGAG